MLPGAGCVVSHCGPPYRSEEVANSRQPLFLGLGRRLGWPRLAEAGLVAAPAEAAPRPARPFSRPLDALSYRLPFFERDTPFLVVQIKIRHYWSGNASKAHVSSRGNLIYLENK